MSHSESIDARRPVTRRRFLQFALAAFGATVLASAGLASFDWLGLRTRAKWQWRTAQNHLTAYRYAFMPADRRIRKHFGDLMIDEAGLQRFVRDYEKHRGRVTFYSVRSNGRLFSTFLLSTDYYRNGADPKRPVHYVTFYDPYVSPCWNPFMRI
jgi:hypothetical protein